MLLLHIFLDRSLCIVHELPLLHSISTQSVRCRSALSADYRSPRFISYMLDLSLTMRFQSRVVRCWYSQAVKSSQPINPSPQWIMYTPYCVSPQSIAHKQCQYACKWFPSQVVFRCISQLLHSITSQSRQTGVATVLLTHIAIPCLRLRRHCKTVLQTLSLPCVE